MSMITLEFKRLFNSKQVLGTFIMFFVIILSAPILSNVFDFADDNNSKLISLYQSLSQFTFFAFFPLTYTIFFSDIKNGVNIFYQQQGYNKWTYYCLKAFFQIMTYIIIFVLSIIICIPLLRINMLDSNTLVILVSIIPTIIYIVLYSFIFAILFKNSVLGVAIGFVVYIVLDLANLTVANGFLQIGSAQSFTTIFINYLVNGNLINPNVSISYCTSNVLTLSWIMLVFFMIILSSIILYLKGKSTYEI